MERDEGLIMFGKFGTKVTEKSAGRWAWKAYAPNGGASGWATTKKRAQNQADNAMRNLKRSYEKQDR